MIWVVGISEAVIVDHNELLHDDNLGNVLRYECSSVGFKMVKSLYTDSTFEIVKMHPQP